MRMGLAPGLRVPRHRATTAHLCAIYPFQAEPGFGARGVYLGTDYVAGEGAFCYDCFQLYTDKVVTNPNMIIIGEPGSGKSSFVKCLLYRSVGAMRSPNKGPRWCAIADPKGEYKLLARALGLAHVRLYPGGSDRLNPLDAGPGAALLGPDAVADRRTAMVGALLGAVLRRDLNPLEDAGVGWAIGHLPTSATGRQPVLADVARLLAAPTAEMVERAGCSTDELIHGIRDARFALGKLLDRDLRGMFDGPSTVRTDWSGRGLVLDLSAVHGNRAALRLVMIATTAWLQALMAFPESEDTPRRYQALDEGYVLLGDEHTARYLETCWKLCRLYGVANIFIGHRLSDLRSQADDGTATAKIAEGLLADTQTRVIFRQSSDQVELTQKALRLTDLEAALLPDLDQGTALWKVAGRAALVQHVVAPGEWIFCDTDSALAV
jgi:hypothetical protein